MSVSQSCLLKINFYPPLLVDNAPIGLDGSTGSFHPVSGSDVHLAQCETRRPVKSSKVSHPSGCEQPVEQEASPQQKQHHYRHQQQQVTVKFQPAPEMGAEKRRKPPRSRLGQQTSGLLVPPGDVDPIVLARQRRPSVSNQGSLSVDQQGKPIAQELSIFSEQPAGN